MQFRVPQNIDLEDKIVGPLTLIQFIYILAGGLVDYILYQSIGSYTAIFLLIAIPIALVAVALAFLKIQDQPLSHFIQAGITYLQRPKVRFWKRGGYVPPVILSPEKKIAQTQPVTITKHIERNDLERLAYLLDTRPQNAASEENFGQVTKSFEKLFKTGYLKVKGGESGSVGQAQATTNSKHARSA